MKGASSGLTRKTTRTSSCIVKPSFEITSNGSNVLASFTGRPLDRLVRRRNNDRRNGQRIDVITSRADDRLLNAAITFGHDISLVSPLSRRLSAGSPARSSALMSSIELCRHRPDRVSRPRFASAAASSCSSRSRIFRAIACRISSAGSLPAFETMTATSPGFTSLADSGSP